MGYHKKMDDLMSDNKKIWDSYVSLSKLNKKPEPTTEELPLKPNDINEGVNEGDNITKNK